MVKLQTVCLRAHNIDVMLRFYSALFGCEPVRVPGINGCEYIFPGEQLILQAEIDAATSTTGLYLSYNVDGVEKEYRRITKRGIACRTIANSPFGEKRFC